MEQVPMPPFGLILCENLPTGVRMPMECPKHNKNIFFFQIFSGFFAPPPRGPWGPPYFSCYNCCTVSPISPFGLLRCRENTRDMV